MKIGGLLVNVRDELGENYGLTCQSLDLGKYPTLWFENTNYEYVTCLKLKNVEVTGIIASESGQNTEEEIRKIIPKKYIKALY